MTDNPPEINRREFLKLAALAVAGSAVVALWPKPGRKDPEPVDKDERIFDPEMVIGAATMMGLFGAEGSGLNTNEIRIRVLLESGIPVKREMNVAMLPGPDIPLAHTTYIDEARWAILKGHSGGPLYNGETPFSVLVNLNVDSQTPAYKVPRWLKVATRPDYVAVLEDGVRAQRQFFIFNGIPEDVANSMIYMTKVIVQGTEYSAATMTHYGQSLWGMLKQGGAGVADDLVRLQVAGYYNRAMAAMVAFYEKTGYFQKDPNPGNIAVMRYIDPASGAEIEKVVVLDYTNVGTHTDQFDQKVVDAMLRRACDHGKTYKIPGVVGNVDELEVYKAAQAGGVSTMDAIEEVIGTIGDISEPKIIDPDPAGLTVANVPEEGIGKVVSVGGENVDTSGMKIVEETTLIAEGVQGRRFKLSKILNLPGARMVLKYAKPLMKPVMGLLDYIGLIGMLWVVHETVDQRYIRAFTAVEDDNERFLVGGIANLDQLWGGLMQARIKNIIDNLRFIPGARKDMNEVIKSLEGVAQTNYTILERRVQQAYITELLNTTTRASVRLDVVFKDSKVPSHQSELEMCAVGDEKNPAIVFIRVKRDGEGNLMNYEPIGIYSRKDGKWFKPDLMLNTDFVVYRTKLESMLKKPNVFLRLESPDELGNIVIRRAISTQK